LEWKKRPTERYSKKPYGKKREWQLKKKKKNVGVSLGSTKKIRIHAPLNAEFIRKADGGGVLGYGRNITD
jgi:hypothetical protein